ncbi:MAG TPA: hypothetical protein VK306_07845 [Acidimicrobiales bacterium]|nr:hypothetical protein [Acidimicrobiales bacterium]
MSHPDRHPDRPGDAPADASDVPLDRTGKATNAELVPDPAGDPVAVGEEAADQADRLENHSRRSTQPEEPAAPS